MRLSSEKSKMKVRKSVNFRLQKGLKFLKRPLFLKD